MVNQFHDTSMDAATRCDDQDTPSISWPNYHSGANGDYQPVLIDGLVHELLHTDLTASGRIEWFPAHPHEGGVSAAVPEAIVLAQGRSTATGRRFNLAVVIDGEHGPDGRPMGRAVAESTFHHFADYNWDLGAGAPSFVTEPPGTQIKADPVPHTGLHGLRPKPRGLVASSVHRRVGAARGRLQPDTSRLGRRAAGPGATLPFVHRGHPGDGDGAALFDQVCWQPL
jgi:hypothetical protein